MKHFELGASGSAPHGAGPGICFASVHRQQHMVQQYGYERDTGNDPGKGARPL